MDCNRCGAPNWSRQHECPARGKKCTKCEKIGHYAKCCRSNKKINRIQEHGTSSAEEDDWSPNTIHCINQKIHSTRQLNKDVSDFFTLTALVDNRPIKFIIDRGSPVTLIPKSLFNRITPLKPLKAEYRDVNDNRIKFEGKTTATIERNGKRNDLEILTTTKKINPLLGLDWMKKLGIPLETGRTDPQINRIVEDLDITTLKRKFKKLVHENHTVKGLEVEIQLKEDARLIQQKGRLILIHLQQSVEKEITKLIKQGHIEKANNIDENCFVSPAVITVKKDKLVKIALEKIERDHNQKKSTNAQHGGINFQDLQKNRGRTGRRNLDFETRPRLRIRSIIIVQRSPEPLHICLNRWKLYRLLPFPEKVLRVSGHTDNIPRKNRPDFRKQTPSMAR